MTDNNWFIDAGIINNPVYNALWDTALERVAYGIDEDLNEFMNKNKPLFVPVGE